MDGRCRIHAGFVAPGAVHPPWRSAAIALVFISHAHRDESLAEGLARLLGDALGLAPSDFFLSSQEGRGVAPAASILTTVVEQLKDAPALLVLLTPAAAASPWVWLEAGNRLGCADKTGPCFIVPSERHVSLLAPVAGQRALRLDNEGELLELVRAVGKSLRQAPREVLDYRPALDGLVQSSAKVYSVAGEKRARLVSWVKRSAFGLILVTVGLTLTVYGGSLVRHASSNAAAKQTLYEYGVNLPGGDLKKLVMDGGPEECETACNAEAQCQAFTWVQPWVQDLKAVCWLKKSPVPARQQSPHTVSGFKKLPVNE
ncbi:MAG: hypothetical protein H6Q86_3565 [candidate division NC10 bacterium]|nr:hypothetical protein [candidate division NC10 bacterium]